MGDQHKEEAGTLLSPDDLEGVREQLLLDCLRAMKVGTSQKALELAEEFFLGTPSTLLHRMWSAYIAASADRGGSVVLQSVSATRAR